MAISDNFSRLAHTPPTIIEGRETYGIWVLPAFLRERPADDFIRVFTVTSALEGRPDLIADRLYGTPLLDWVLIAFNRATGVLNWPPAGTLLEYPLDNVVLPELL